MSLLLAIQVKQEPEPEPIQAIKKDGGGIKTRRRVSTQPNWLPEIPIDDDEALLIILGAF